MFQVLAVFIFGCKWLELQHHLFVFVSTDINCAPFLNSENKEMNHYFPIKHPYWQLYMSLLAVDSLDRSDAKQLLRRLAAEVDFSPVDRLYLEMQMSSPWFIPTKCHYLFFERMREKYCYSVMHPDTIDLLKQLSPIVELGAGNGYNAWLLAQAGVDVVALEAYPPHEGKNWFFGTNIFGLPKKNFISWTDVVKGTSIDLLQYPRHNLFISWPPLNEMAFDALRFYRGNIVILIANRANCGSPRFYRKLEKDWHLEYAKETGGWSGFQNERLEIYCRDKHLFLRERANKFELINP